jgi:uncharacterized membrane protein YoaK (UPF0700 family)
MRSGGQIYIAGFLTWIAGFVDAVGFLALVQIYTANMSGNSVAIGVRLWEQDWMEAARRICPVVVYVIGLFMGRILLEIAGRARIRSIAAGAFGLEILILLPASFAHSLSHSQSASAEDFALIGLLSLAMGLQNATLTHFSSLTLHTGFVTGTLVKMVEQFTKYITWLYDEVIQPRFAFVDLLSRSIHQKNFRTGALLAAVWTAYVLGAFCGAAGHSWLNLKSLYIAMGGLLMLALIDLQTPLAMSDEQEQVNPS